MPLDVPQARWGGPTLVRGKWEGIATPSFSRSCFSSSVRTSGGKSNWKSRKVGGRSGSGPGKHQGGGALEEWSGQAAYLYAFSYQGLCCECCSGKAEALGGLYICPHFWKRKKNCATGSTVKQLLPPPPVQTSPLPWGWVHTRR